MARAHIECVHLLEANCSCGERASVSHMEYSHIYYCYECESCRTRLKTLMAMDLHVQNAHKAYDGSSRSAK